jgi:hypothetical protein
MIIALDKFAKLFYKSPPRIESEDRTDGMGNEKYDVYLSWVESGCTWVVPVCVDGLDK